MPRYRVTRNFAFNPHGRGAVNLRAGDIVDFNGETAIMNGTTLEVPQLRQAITAGWLEASPAVPAKPPRVVGPTVWEILSQDED